MGSAVRPCLHAAGPASKSELDRTPYGRCEALPHGRTFLADCCEGLQLQAVKRLIVVSRKSRMLLDIFNLADVFSNPQKNMTAPAPYHAIPKNRQTTEDKDSA
jgi:hypothetical protein